MSATTERVSALVAPLLADLGLSLYDVDQPGGTLRVMVQREGGVDLDALTEATREISAALDSSEPVAGSYTLEVSSPGLERPLRHARHFAGAVGERIKVKLFPGSDGERRCEGVLSSVGDSTVTVTTPEGDREIQMADISGAHTVFVWDKTRREDDPPHGDEPAAGASAATTGPAPGEEKTGSTTESTSDSERDI